jgi:hypothetical protein
MVKPLKNIKSVKVWSDRVGGCACDRVIVFYLEYAIKGREIQTYITLPSSEACQIFIRDNEDMDQYMFADGDVNMWCLDTGVMSESIRPKLRPEGEQWETSS